MGLTRPLCLGILLLLAPLVGLVALPHGPVSGRLLVLNRPSKLVQSLLNRRPCILLAVIVRPRWISTESS